MTLYKPQREHFVPKLILKNFVSLDPAKSKQNELEVFSIKEKTWVRSRTYTRIAAQFGIYDVDTDEAIKQKEQNIIEKKFSELEGDVAKIFREKIFEEESLNEIERCRLALFFANMHVRTPKFLDFIENHFNTSFEVIKGYLVENIKNKIDTYMPESMKELLRNDEVRQLMIDNPPKITATNNAIMHSMVQVGAALSMIIYHMDWKILIANEEKDFITSDNPLIIHNHKLINHPLLGHGFLSSDKVCAYMPLTPKLCFKGQWKLKDFVLAMKEHYTSEYKKDYLSHMIAHLQEANINISVQELKELQKIDYRTFYEDKKETLKENLYLRIDDKTVDEVNKLIIYNSDEFLYSNKQFSLDMSNTPIRRKEIIVKDTPTGKLIKTQDIHV